MLGFGNFNQYKNFSFPFLQFESSEEATQNIDGIENIVEFLVENKFIHDFRTHSVYEKEGIEFAECFIEIFEKEFKSKFSNKFSFFFRITNFKEARYWYNPLRDGYIYRSRLISRIYRLVKETIKDLFVSNKKQKLKEFPNDLNKKADDWVQRLNSSTFHGGDVPDAADFRVIFNNFQLYGIVRKYLLCRRINYYFRKEGNLNQNFINWIDRMSLLCTRSSFYNLRETAYVFKPNESEEINERERINKETIVTSKAGAFGGDRRKRAKMNI